MGVRERLQSKKNDLQDNWALLREKLYGLEQEKDCMARRERFIVRKCPV